MKHKTDELLLAFRVARANRSAALLMLVDSVEECAIRLHLVDEGVHAGRRSIGDRVRRLGTVEMLPHDFTVLVRIREVHVVGAPILDVIILGAVKDVAAERRILSGLSAQSRGEVRDVEVVGARVAEQHEPVHVEVAPEAAADDVVVTLHAVQEWLHELSVEGVGSGAGRDVAGDVHGLVVLLGLSELVAQPGDLAAGILRARADLLVLVIVHHGVENDETQARRNLQRVVATLLESGEGICRQEVLPALCSQGVHPVVGCRELVLRVTVVVPNDRIDRDLATERLLKLGELVSNVLHFKLDNTLREHATALCSGITRPQDKQRILVLAGIGTQSRNSLHCGVLNLERCTAVVIAKLASLALARIASIRNRRALLIVTLHVSI